MSGFDDHFVKADFKRQVINLAVAHGDFPFFWLQNLERDANPDATWRTLMVLGCMGDPHHAHLAYQFMVSNDSRVRAWACFALGQMRDRGSLKELEGLCHDPSTRVRVQAHQAISAIRGMHHHLRHRTDHHNGNNKLILISDDAVKVQNNLSGALAMMGFRVAVAASEGETLQKARHLKPAAIITDNQKGHDNLSGLNMTWDICRDAELRETLIFMLTADCIEPVFLWHGGDYYLTKSVDPLEKVIGVVSDYLQC